MNRKRHQKSEKKAPIPRSGGEGRVREGRVRPPRSASSSPHGEQHLSGHVFGMQRSPALQTAAAYPRPTRTLDPSTSVGGLRPTKEMDQDHRVSLASRRPLWRCSKERRSHRHLGRCDPILMQPTAPPLFAPFGSTCAPHTHGDSSCHSRRPSAPCGLY